MKIDYHVHTVEGSNESVPVKDVVELAKKEEIDAIAITDHNSTRAIAKAQLYAMDELMIIPGLEIDAEIEGKRGHILCLYPDFGNSEFQSELDELNHKREQRMIDTVTKFYEKRLMTMDQTDQVHAKLLSLEGSLTRIAIADTIINLFKESDTLIGARIRDLDNNGEDLSLTSKVLYTFIDKKSPEELKCYVGYEPQYTTDYKQVFDFCLKHNGVAGFAHLCYDIKDQGLATKAFRIGTEKGMTLIGYRHPEHSEDDIALLKSLATQYNVHYKKIRGPIVKVNGTDYHAKPEMPQLGSISSDRSSLEQIQHYADQIRH